MRLLQFQLGIPVTLGLVTAPFALPRAVGQIVIPGAEASMTWTAEAEFDFFGEALASVGDIDGDGVSDLAFSAILHDNGRNTEVGRVYLYSARDGHLLYTLDGEFADDMFGESISGLGDINGDGRADFVVGAWRADHDRLTDAGKVYVYSGGDGKLIYSINGPHADEWFGTTTAALGDVNGDGISDFAVGAPNASPSGRIGAGRVYFFDGATGAPLRRSLPGQATGDAFGRALSPTGDLDGDGLADLLIGAPYQDFAGGDAGRAYTFSSSTFDIIGRYNQEKNNPFAARGALGFSVGRAGDIDQDGVEDVLVGVPENLSNGGGHAFVYSGATGERIRMFNGTMFDEFLGTSVAGMGDVNGDGVPDIAAGGIQLFVGGHVIIFSGATGEALYEFTTENRGDYFGGRIANAGDTDGNGVNDLLVSAIYNDDAGDTAGKVYLFRLP